MNQWLVGVGGASHCVTEHTSLIRAIPINRVKKGHAQTITAWLRDVHQGNPTWRQATARIKSPKPPTGELAGGQSVRIGEKKTFSFWFVGWIDVLFQRVPSTFIQSEDNVTAAPRLAFWFLKADKRKSCSKGSWVITAVPQLTVGRIAYKDGNESLVEPTLWKDGRAAR